MPNMNGSGQGRGGMSGRGRMNGPKMAGPGGQCVCAQCGFATAHVRGTPCNSRECPKCGSKMSRR